MRSALFQEELSEQRRRGMTETQKFIVDTMDRPVPQCLTTSRKERRMQPIVRKVLGLNYISRESRGREVLFVLIGSASATGSMQTNERLSRERSQAPEPIIDQYLVNVPHKYIKVYGLGDMLSPKGATLTVDQRYQNVRIVAVYQTDQVPVLPTAPRS
jgi:hypothetical protein